MFNVPRTPTLLSAAGLLALSLTVSACGETGLPEAERRDEALPAVRVAPVVRQPVRSPIRVAGTFAPAREVALAFRIGGVVDRVSVDAGDAVSRGQLLARLDLQEIEAALSRARSGHEKAVRDLARVERLYADSVLSLATLQDARTAEEVARAHLAEARFNRRYSEIRAPADGEILDRRADPGETVGPGSPILILGSRNGPGLVRVALSDRDRMRVARGDSARVAFDALPDRTFPGTVTRVGAAASPATGTWEVEVTLDGWADESGGPETADPRPRSTGPEPVPGMVGRVTLFPADGVDAALVPVEALLEADGDRGLLLALASAEDGGRVRRLEVRVGALYEDRVAILGGLDGVTRVVTEGAAWLADDARVEVIR